ncbi:LysR family transcriptional regulator [Rhizobium sp. XQZ8]|uniref:LysR family transcriptional regulator n=1 Tax=Rhizobium populisoli TaxID=2859785 RepID=UPI001CA51A27|nr:LysR family transcriptional regulator [Rhizobium populisoli]MBW6424977.1 LysR family transcriptional regulator [Rhizobium populisoli]
MQKWQRSLIFRDETNEFYEPSDESGSSISVVVDRMNYSSRVDFLGLHAFVAIADRGSFRDAATHLNLSHTAISHRIRKLEDELGQKLFVRTSREVRLTQAAVDLLPKVKQTLAQLASSMDELRRAGEGRHNRLSIACLPTIAAGRLPHILKRFHETHPEVFVQIYDQSASEISDLVERGTVEFGVTINTSHRWDFDTEVLVDDPFVLVCPMGHLLTQKDRVEWSDLEGYPLIRVSQHSGNRMIIDDALAGTGDHLVWRYEAQHLQTAIAMAHAGAALAVVPQMAFASADEESLGLRQLHNPQVTRQIGIVSRRGVPLSPTATALRNLVREAFR